VSASHVRVNAADLVSHASEIDRIGDGLITAQQAGVAVRVDSGAYGKLCQIVPALLNILQDQVINATSTAAQSAQDIADAVRATAAGYDSSDSRAATRIRDAR
jgi:hypothetical protein